jgi:hypothetical protein
MVVHELYTVNTSSLFYGKNMGCPFLGGRKFWRVLNVSDPFLWQKYGGVFTPAPPTPPDNYRPKPDTAHSHYTKI